MQLFSHPKAQIQLFRSRNPNSSASKSIPKFPFNPHSSHSHLRLPSRSSNATSAAPLQQKQPTPLSSGSDSEEDLDGFIRVRRPVKDEAQVSGAEEVDNDVEVEVEEDLEIEKGEEAEEEGGLDKGLSAFAKRMPMFEPPERVEVGVDGKPLGVNLELWLYRAKVMGRKFMFKDAEKLLRKCIFFWPEDGRAYVALGKILGKQFKFAEARLVYETGCQATQGENPYIWQCWAVLENKMGNTRRARELFDAATVADEKHVAAWHGWAVLEIKQGNITKARNLLGKGLKCCGENEYIYQTLALLEVKANRVEQARYLFQRATACNPKSCASWLAWAQLETQQENNQLSRKLFEKAVQASPKNRYAWHVWAIFEASQGEIDKARKLLKIGHTLNPRDPVLLQSLALLEYKHSSANLARALFRKASKLDPRHQPIWMAWGWMEWKEGNITTAKGFYQKALSIDSTSETAARCLQAWGVLEQRLGNLSAARRLFRSSLNINSQSYVTWMTWASFEEEQGNSIRAEEIRNLYFQQRTEVVDDASWVMGFLDVIDPAVASIKRLLNLNQNQKKIQDTVRNIQSASDESLQESEISRSSPPRDGDVIGSEDESTEARMGEDQAEANLTSVFDLDSFIKDKLSLDAAKLDIMMERSSSKKNISSKRIWRSDKTTASAQP